MALYLQDDFIESANALPKYDRMELIDAWAQLYETGVEVSAEEFKHVYTWAVYHISATRLLRQRTNSANRTKAATKRERNAKESHNESATKRERNAYDVATTLYEKENENEKESATTDVVARKKTARRFSPPSVEEVQEYSKESGHIVDARRFVDFYASKGWKVGNSPMKDWQAAVRNWARREVPNAPAFAADEFAC